MCSRQFNVSSVRAKLFGALQYIRCGIFTRLIKSLLDGIIFFKNSQNVDIQILLQQIKKELYVENKQESVFAKSNMPQMHVNLCTMFSLNDPVTWTSETSSGQELHM